MDAPSQSDEDEIDCLELEMTARRRKIVCRIVFLALITWTPTHTIGQSDSSPNPVTDVVRGVYPAFQSRILAAFAEMPEEKYGFQPAQGLMTCGELATHITGANNYYCRILGPKPWKQANLQKSSAAKTDLMRESLDTCARIIVAARDATLGELVALPSGTMDSRALVLLRLVSGMDHPYGQAASHLRLAGRLPPTAVKVTQKPKPRLVETELTSKVFGNTRMLRILLPVGYDDPANSNRRYPVLYMNDGQNLFDVSTSVFNRMEWQVDETIARLGCTTRRLGEAVSRRPGISLRTEASKLGIFVVIFRRTPRSVRAGPGVATARITSMWVNRKENSDGPIQRN